MDQAIDQLERGRAACAQAAWKVAFEALSEADRAAPLDREDLDRLATAAYLLGRHDDHETALERLHREHLRAGDVLRAARAAYWLGMHLFNEGRGAQASGWLGRAQRLVERAGEDCVERGYLLLPVMFQREGAGDLAGAEEAATGAAEYGERFGDPELLALATYERGHLLIDLGRVQEGQRLLDEAMVSVTADELSPIVSGIVYCGVILACQSAFDVRRAREWTAALSRWCERQPDMVAYTGRCLVHRAEILQRDGEWGQALDEARLARGRCAAAGNNRAAGEAAYIQGELHRLRGELGAADEAYREASGWGRDPQPGLALMRLALGDTAAAAASIRRALAGITARARRAWLLPACVEIMLLCGRMDEAEEATAELEGIAAGHEEGLLGALAAQARGSVALVGGDGQTALGALRRALETWQELGAPYETARVRVLLALACRELGDQDATVREIAAAREVFARLGATEPPGLGGREAGTGGDGHGLTARELEVLRLVAAGLSNKAIAAELVLSERTIHRHVSNILAKLRVSSRSAATAYAYEHSLI